MSDKKPMTFTQEAALRHMADAPRGETCGYYLLRLGLGNTATLKQLEKRGYVEQHGMGHMAFPSSADWRITPEGRAAIAKAKGQP